MRSDGMTLLLPAVAGSLEALTFDADRMKAAVTSTMMATDLADYLVRKRVTFREAHGAVGQLVREAEEKAVRARRASVRVIQVGARRVRD